MALGLFILSFFTGTHLPSSHLSLSIPGMVLMMVALVNLFLSRHLSARIRGGALTLFLLFFLSSLLGWSVLAETMPPLFHGIFMGLFGVGAVFLTYDLYQHPQGAPA